jgi:sugar/nucleoside kinase (ribokinase family)
VLAGLDWPAVLRRANAAGALACTRVGAWSADARAISALAG